MSTSTRRMNLKGWALLLGLFAGPASLHADDAPSISARILAEATKLADPKKPYGTEKGQYVCSTFVVAVLKTVLGPKITTAVEAAINVRAIEGNADARKAAVAADDPALRGVQKALVDATLGEEVKSLSDLQAGDLVQYWYLEAGEWVGHVGVVKSVAKATATGADIQLIGAHRSSDGTGVIDVQLRLNTKRQTRVFAVRVKG